MNVLSISNFNKYPSIGFNGEVNKTKENQDTKTVEYDKNPISKNGEKIVLFSGALISAMGIIIKTISRMYQEDTDGSLGKSFSRFINKIIDKKNPNISGKNRDTMFIGTSLMVLGLIVVGGGILSVLAKAPKLNYEGNVNAFVKSKEMDSYIKGNKAEVELYNQMNERAKSTFDPQERQKLYSSYMMLQNAKNMPPSWVNN